MLTFVLFAAFSCFSPALGSISAKQWGLLSNALDGHVSLPTHSTYPDDYILWAATYDNVQPEAIIFCQSEKDVQKAVKFVNKYKDDIKSFRIRTCRHSVSGGSTTNGVIIDVQALQDLDITIEGTAVVGPGVDLASFTQWAYEHDVTLVHGDCASVCFGGFLAGGGFGLTSRTFGLGADWIKSIRVVLPNGDLVVADKDGEYSDLFWALRGAGQGNYGVITQFEMNIPEKKLVNPGLFIELSFPYTSKNWRNIGKIWKKYAENKEYGDYFGVYLRISPDYYISQDYSIGLHGFWTGEQVDGLLVIANLLYEINLTPTQARVDYVAFEGWMDGSAPDRLRYSAHCSSRFGFDDLDTGFFHVVNQYTTKLINYEVDPQDRAIMESKWHSECDASGKTRQCKTNYAVPTHFMFIAPGSGGVARHAPDETAFPWREAKYLWVDCLRYMAEYPNSYNYAHHWIKSFSSDVEAYLSDKSFVNFPDPELDNYHYRFFGDNYPRLQRLKAKYDPDNLFKQPHGVVAAGVDAAKINQVETFEPNNPNAGESLWDRERGQYPFLQARLKKQKQANLKSKEPVKKGFTISIPIFAAIVVLIAFGALYCIVRNLSKRNDKNFRNLSDEYISIPHYESIS